MKSLRFGALICTFAMLLVMMSPVTAYASASDLTIGVGQGTSTETMSINVIDADVRDVLSAVAVNMGYSIVYTGEISRITVELNNLTPSAAFDYLLKILGMTYLREGNTLIVGSREALAGDFARSLSLTKFHLTYIKSQVLTQKIAELKIPVTVLTLATNEKTLWVQGFPVDVGKVRELINMLDIEENYDDGNLDSNDPTRKTLSSIPLDYITPYDFNRFLKTLGIENGIATDEDERRLWIYANGDERRTILEISEKVDRKRNYITPYDVDSFQVIRVVNVPKAAAIAAITNMCPSLTVISVDNASKAFMVNGTRLEIERAEEIVDELETINNSKISTTFFVYNLEHITAAEASRRLENVRFADSVFEYSTTHEEFANALFVYCNSDYADQIKELLQSIDTARAPTVMGMPIFLASNMATASSVENYLQTMLGTQISGTFDYLTMGDQVVLYLRNSDAETVQLVEQMLNRLTSINTDDGNVDVSWQAFVAEVGEDVANGPNGLALYGAWVKMKLGGKVTGASLMTYTGPALVDENTGENTPSQDNTPSAPVGDNDEAKVISAMTAITQWFDDKTGSYHAVSDTQAATVVNEANNAVRAAGLTGVSVISDPESATGYVAPTADTTGELIVTLKVTSGEASDLSIVYLILPKTSLESE